MVTNIVEDGQPIEDLPNRHNGESEVNLDGVKSTTDFQVIEIVDETNPYLVLLGMDWEFGNSTTLNLKNKKMSLSEKKCHSLYPYTKENGKGI